MRSSSVMRLAVSGVLCSSGLVSSLSHGDADAIFDAFNKAFLVRNESVAYYRKSLATTQPDGTWMGSHDIYAAQDAYRRKGDSHSRDLVSDLVSYWLRHLAPRPWDGDGWNDDLGWYTIGLMRGYQAIGTKEFLDASVYGNDYVFQRGWDTKYNDGGIWETNPEYLEGKKKGTEQKEALSNSPNALVACMIYQSTLDQKYLDRCKKIYDWTRRHLFDASTGLVKTRVHKDGKVDPWPQSYNQGVFLDVANLLWKITGDKEYYQDARLAMDYVVSGSKVNGMFNVTLAQKQGGSNEFARGAGNFVYDNNLWDKYYDFFESVGNAIVEGRNSIGLSSGPWAKPRTESDEETRAFRTNSPVAWLQYVPPDKPVGSFAGIRNIVSKQTEIAVDSAGTVAEGKPVVCRTWSKSSQEQRWLFTGSDQGTWSIVNLDTWHALEAPESSASGSTVVQSQDLRTDHQLWLVTKVQPDLYKITNKATGLALDAGSPCGAKKRDTLTQRKYTGSNTQLWYLKGIEV